MSPDAGGQPDRIRVVRIIARLNIGGPAIQAITLTKRLEELGYDTTLVRGREEPDEGNMDHLAAELGVQPLLVPTLRRNPGLHDLSALATLIRIIRRERPHIVHTHAAKGGTLGRVATLIAYPLRRRRPIVIHTYHGHSLTGYFSSRTANVYRNIERFLARFSDRLIAVSQEVRDELVAMRVAPASKFEVVPLGFDLSAFQVAGFARTRERKRVRAELGIAVDTRVVTLVARLVPIKRVDRFLRIAAMLSDIDVYFLVVGNGELGDLLRHSPEAQALGSRLTWAGFRKDMPAVYFASDVVALTSDNEGTPVSLIEALAAGVPVVSTRVGGTASVVEDDRLLAAADDEAAFAARVRAILTDRGFAAELACRHQTRTLRLFSIDRLLADIHHTYQDELSAHSVSCA